MTMTGEPISARQSSTVPPTAAEHLGLAERFSSFTDYARYTSSLPQTAAATLDVARFHAFTGELTFSVEPAVRLYLDGGVVYHAERQGDPAVSAGLIDAGVIDSVQLLRGVVSVGDVEHLGRLFDRDATVDRDAVMVVLEARTDALVQQIANSMIAAVSAISYRHHPSGIHRWFVAPVERTAARRPASGVMQIDRSVVDELPRLGGSAESGGAREDSARADVTIEWAEPDLSRPDSTGDAGDEPPHRAAADVDIQAELDRFDADRADWAATSGGNDPDPSDVVSSPVGEFRIIWPDGTRDPSIVDASASARPRRRHRLRCRLRPARPHWASPSSRCRSTDSPNPTLRFPRRSRPPYAAHSRHSEAKHRAQRTRASPTWTSPRWRRRIPPCRATRTIRCCNMRHRSTPLQHRTRQPRIRQHRSSQPHPGHRHCHPRRPPPIRRRRLLRRSASLRPRWTCVPRSSTNVRVRERPTTWRWKRSRSSSSTHRRRSYRAATLRSKMFRPAVYRSEMLRANRNRNTPTRRTPRRSALLRSSTMSTRRSNVRAHCDV